MISQKSIREYTKDTLLRDNNYLYIQPHPLLRPFISNYTVTFPTAQTMPDEYTIMPAASPTLVFSIDNRGILGGLRGSNTKSGIIGTHANQYIFLLLIEFHPYGLKQFIRVNQSELTDQNFIFESIDRRLYQTICTALESSDNIIDLVLALDTILLSFNSPAGPKEELTLSLRSIIDQKGIITNKELSDSVYYSERHLNRLFQEGIGMNVKTFSKIVRVNHALRLLRNPGISLACAAQFCGFHDQAHFTHDFKSICGVTPNEYRSRMSIYYNENFKL